MNVPHSRFAEAVKAAAATPDEEQALVAATAILEGPEALAVFGLDAPKPEAGTENAGDGGPAIAAAAATAGAGGVVGGAATALVTSAGGVWIAFAGERRGSLPLRS